MFWACMHLLARTEQRQYTWSWCLSHIMNHQNESTRITLVSTSPNSARWVSISNANSLQNESPWMNTRGLLSCGHTATSWWLQSQPMQADTIQSKALKEGAIVTVYRHDCLIPSQSHTRDYSISYITQNLGNDQNCYASISGSCFFIFHEHWHYEVLFCAARSHAGFQVYSELSRFPPDLTFVFFYMWSDLLAG